MIPTDLAYFIDQEERDFRRRKREVQMTGRVLVRVPPTATKYQQHQSKDALTSAEDIGPLYSSWIVSVFQTGNGHVLSLGQGTTKPWHGDPMAVLCKSLSAPGHRLFKAPPELQNLGRLYEDHDEELRRLQGLPKSQRGPVDNHGPEADGNRQEHRDDSSEDHSRDDRPRQGSSSQLRRSVRQKSSGYTGGQNQIQQPLLELVRSRRPRARVQKIAYWQPSKKRIKLESPPPVYEWGPESTAQDVIEFGNFFPKTEETMFWECFNDRWNYVKAEKTF
ncbi:MAG: hypothetical protein Q9196_007062 [Gyalolechia fulgens]